MTAPVCWQGPDVAIVAWIPFFATMSAMPPQHNYATSIANHLLFMSGNPDPPTRFNDFADFGRQYFPLDPAGSKEYRALLVLKDVRLWYVDGDQFPKVKYESHTYIGFTPPRVIVFGVNALPWITPVQGIGTHIPSKATVIPPNNGVEIKVRIEFKLSSLFDSVQKLLTGFFAPYASVVLLYRITANGKADISVESTRIPSHSVYIDWERAHESSMLTCTRTEIDSFMNRTPGCSVAPSAVQPIKTVNAKRCSQSRGV